MFENNVPKVEPKANLSSDLFVSFAFVAAFHRLFYICVEKQRIGHDLMYRGHFKIMILITFSEVTAFVGTEIKRY